MSEQNLRLAKKVLDQQAEINQLQTDLAASQARVEALEGEVNKLKEAKRQDAWKSACDHGWQDD